MRFNRERKQVEIIWSSKTIYLGHIRLRQRNQTHQLMIEGKSEVRRITGREKFFGSESLDHGIPHIPLRICVRERRWIAMIRDKHNQLKYYTFSGNYMFTTKYVKSHTKCPHHFTSLSPSKSYQSPYNFNSPNATTSMVWVIQ